MLTVSHKRTTDMNIIRNILLVCFFVFFLPKICLAAPQATIHKLIGLDLGYGTFSFAEKIDQKIVYPVANLTTALAYKRFISVINISGSIDDASISEESETGSASRTDIDFTTGYQFSKRFSGFIGYKNGETKYNWRSRPKDDSIILAPTSLAKESYKQSGPYVGVSINWKFEQAGKLSISVAYSKLNAINRFFSDGDGIEEGETKEFDDINGKTSNKSTGYSYSLNWTMPLKGNLLFKTRFKTNSYTQDIKFEGETFKGIREKSSILSVGLSGIF